MVCLNQKFDTRVKTFYLGFHDAAQNGVKPFLQYEPEPIREEISHSQALKIIKQLHLQLQVLIEQEISKPVKSDNGAWP